MKSTLNDPWSLSKIYSKKLEGIEVPYVDVTCRGASIFPRLGTRHKAQSFESKSRSIELWNKLDGVRIEFNYSKNYKLHENGFLLQIGELEFRNCTSIEEPNKSFMSISSEVLLQLQVRWPIWHTKMYKYFMSNLIECLLPTLILLFGGRKIQNKYLINYLV